LLTQFLAPSRSVRLDRRHGNPSLKIGKR